MGDWQRGPRAVLALAAWLLLSLLGTGSAGAHDATVRAVLFYSPSCGHCHQVMTEDLPPLLQEYGSGLQILAVSVTEPPGEALYMAMAEHLDLPPERLGVPTLLVGDTVLVGSQEIPEQFPGLIDRLLAEGGTDWPSIPGLADLLLTLAPSPTATSAPSEPAASPARVPTESPGGLTGASPASDPVATDEPGVGSDPVAMLQRDPPGNSLAIIVLVGLVGALAWALGAAANSGRRLGERMPSTWIPALALAGLAVASYLAFVETGNGVAVCGPLGDCNTVQQSQYARLFGMLPIGVLGVLGYLAIIGAWLVGRFAGARRAKAARVGLVAMTVAGTAFSVYLTVLEPFVIGATCAWCLTSAAIMAALMLVSVHSTTTPGPDLVSRTL